MLSVACEGSSLIRLLSWEAHKSHRVSSAWFQTRWQRCRRAEMHPNSSNGIEDHTLGQEPSVGWLKNTWKDAQHHSLSEKCKWKPQWVSITRQSGWLLSKSLQAINAGEGVEKREPSYTVGGNANQNSCYGKQCGDFLKKLEIELPCDPAIPLLGIHTEETRSERDTCTPMFIAALFIIARSWKQPRCPSADEWIRKLWYIYTMEYYSAIKKNSFESILMRWMKLEPII